MQEKYLPFRISIISFFFLNLDKSLLCTDTDHLKIGVTGENYHTTMIVLK